MEKPKLPLNKFALGGVDANDIIFSILLTCTPLHHKVMLTEYIFADDQQQEFKSTLNLLTVSDVNPSSLQFRWNWYLMFWEFAKAISFESLDAENATPDDKLSY